MLPKTDRGETNLGPLSVKSDLIKKRFVSLEILKQDMFGPLVWELIEISTVHPTLSILQMALILLQNKKNFGANNFF